MRENAGEVNSTKAYITNGEISTGVTLYQLKIYNAINLKFLDFCFGVGWGGGLFNDAACNAGYIASYGKMIAE
jgi:hypothetical protein